MAKGEGAEGLLEWLAVGHERGLGRGLPQQNLGCVALGSAVGGVGWVGNQGPAGKPVTTVRPC